MPTMLVLLIIGVSVAIILVALHQYAPAVYHAIISYTIRILKGLIYASVQFFKYVQGKPGQTRLSDLEAISQLSSKNSELQIAYDSIIMQLQSVQLQVNELSKELKSCTDEKNNIALRLEKKNKEFDKLLKNYDEIRGRLYPVSSEHVSEVFCQEFEKITSIIEKAESFLYELSKTEPLPENHQLLVFLQTKQNNDIISFHGWYLTLKYASSLTGVGALDIDSYTNYKEQIDYLRRNAFTRYYRPILSSLLLCMEQYRVQSVNKQEWNSAIMNTIGELKNFNIDVNYIPTGAKYESTSIDNIIITESKNANAPVGVVEEVISIGINTSELDVPIQETEIIMNL